MIQIFRRTGRISLLTVVSWLFLTTTLGAPANDSLTTPASLAVAGEIVTVELTGATLEPNEPNHLALQTGESARSVWYAWIAPSDGAVFFSVGGSENASAFATLYNASSGLGANGHGSAVGESLEIVPVQRGKIYLLAVGDQFVEAKPVTLRWRFLENPDNDLWTRRQRLSSDGTRVSGWPSLQQSDSFEQPFGWASLVWYEWTAPAAGRAIVDFNPVYSRPVREALRVFRADTPNRDNEVVLTDGGVPVAAGDRLQLGVAPLYHPPGPYELGIHLETARLTFDPPVPNDSHPSIRARVSVTPFDGDIREVEFYRDGARISVESPAPYEIELGTIPAGYYEFKAALVRRDGTVQWVPAETLTVRPANDDFSAAATLVGEEPTGLVNLITATSEPDEPVHGLFDAQRSAWWSWKAPRSGVVSISAAPSTPDQFNYPFDLAVYSGNSLATLVVVARAEITEAVFSVTEGVTYHIALNLSQASPTEFALRLELFPPVPNDFFATATPLTGERLQVTGSPGAATVEPGEPDSGNPNIHSLWWSWTAPAAGFVTVEPSDSWERTRVEVFQGDTIQGLVRQQPEAGGGLFRWPVGAGTRLVIRAFPEWAQIRQIGFDLTFETPPVNDAFASATTIESLPFRLEGNLLYATVEPGEPVHQFDNPSSRTVWYRWTPAESGRAMLRMSDGDAASAEYVAVVYRGDTLGELVEVVKVAPGGGFGTLNAEAGQTFWIVVDGGRSSNWELPFELTLWPPPPNDHWISAVELAGHAALANGYTMLATQDAGEPSFGLNSAGQTVWYGWTAPADGTATLSVKALAYTLPVVFTGASVSELTRMNTPWDSVTNEGARLVVFEAEKGVRYWIGVDAGWDPEIPGSPTYAMPKPFELRLGLSNWRVMGLTEGTVLAEGDNLLVEAAPSTGIESALAELRFQLGGNWHPDATSPSLSNPPFRHTYSNLWPGLYTVLAVGETADGAPQSSQPISFRVAPANDAMADASLLPSLPIFVNGLFAGATEEPDEPLLAEQTGSASRWWKWIAPRSGTVWINLHGAMGVFVETPSGPMQPVASFGHTDDWWVTGTFNAVAGTTYFLKFAPRVTAGTPAGVEVAFVLTMAWLPENDSFATPIILDGIDLVVTSDHTAASAEAGEPGPGIQPPSRTLWYSWTAPVDGWLVLHGSVMVLTGDTLPALTRVGYTFNPNFPLQLPVRGGETYRIVADALISPTPTVAEWRLQFVGPQANDSFSGRLPLSGLPVELAGTNLGATREAGEPEGIIEPWGNHPSGAIVNTLWYTWTSPVSGTVAIFPEGESPTVLAEVFFGQSLETLQRVSPNALPGSTTFVAEAGRTYAISVGSLTNAVGPFRLTLIGPPPNDHFENATVLAPTATEISGTLLFSTVDPSDPQQFPWARASVWFQWTAPARGRVTFGRNYTVSVWLGDQLCELRRVDSKYPGQFRAERGVTYRFLVLSSNDSDFQTNLTLDPLPPNDDFPDAIQLTGADIEAGGATFGATEAEGEDAPEVWWRWTAPGNGHLTVTVLEGDPVEVFRSLGATRGMKQTVSEVGAYPVFAGLEYHFRARAGVTEDPVRFRIRFVPDPLPELTGVRADSAGSLLLPVRGRPGQTVEFESSADLQNWFPTGRHWLIFPEERVAWPMGESAVEFLRVRDRGSEP